MNDALNPAQAIKRIEEVMKTRDEEREKRSTDRHARIQEFQTNMLEKLKDFNTRISANEKGRYVLYGIYIASVLILTTVWAVFTFFTKT